MEKKSLIALDKAGLERQSEFRYRLRRFLRFGEEAARAAGVTAVQYHLMLHTQAFPGREWASIGELAERLQTQQHGVVALVTRCEEAGLVRRKENQEDRRLVEVHLTAKGRRCVEKLAALHFAELGNLAEVIEAARASAAPG
ncbi:MAG TPA: MarR family transcriptional regulator [Ramlibacter sp.]|uniref:MarR family winged helix-turn-helix transcriptional regulator n=1 Tax=Ramlibacter sp. TaxID=1917967 RepID=UPI002D80C0B5|nr:MarR family transcriptional regulator [Ramlibacter sp.]HET8747369.1 MarR family transcriptional regulator [Ramlibacter sp.]